MINSHIRDGAWLEARGDKISELPTRRTDIEMLCPYSFKGWFELDHSAADKNLNIKSNREWGSSGRNSIEGGQRR
jgi:hypothetical protein